MGGGGGVHACVCVCVCWRGGGGSATAHLLYRWEMMCLFYTLGLMTGCIIAAK